MGLYSLKYRFLKQEYNMSRFHSLNLIVGFYMLRFQSVLGSGDSVGKYLYDGEYPSLLEPRGLIVFAN